MGDGEEDRAEPRSSETHFRLRIARAFGGAMVFSLPVLMTREMWNLGFYMSRQHNGSRGSLIKLSRKSL